MRDISRTFPLEPLFRQSSSVGQNLLANVLKACLAFHRDVGCVTFVVGRGWGWGWGSDDAMDSIDSTQLIILTNSTRRPALRARRYMQGMNYVAAALLFALRRQLLPPSPFTHAAHARCQHLHEAFPPEYTAGLALNTSVSGSRKASHPSASSVIVPPPPVHGGGVVGGSSGQWADGHPPSPTPSTTATTTTTDEEGEDGYRSDHSAQSLEEAHSSASSASSFSGHRHGQSRHCHRRHRRRRHHASSLTSSTDGGEPVRWEDSPAQMRAACDTFWLMTAAMSSSSGLAMRLLWHPEVPHLKLRTFQFEQLLALHLPRLHAHFRHIRLAPDILVRGGWVGERGREDGGKDRPHSALHARVREWD